MNRLFSVILGAVLFLFGGIADARPYQFRKLDASSGLPDNNVRDALMLPDGLMCFQTTVYLCFYNGAVCWNYRWDPVRIPYTEFSGAEGLEYDGQSNRILLKNRDHAWAFDRTTREFVYDGYEQTSPVDSTREEVAEAEPASHSETVEAPGGKRWFMSDKQIVCYSPKSGELTECERIPEGSDDLFTSIALDRDGNLWVGTARSGVRILYRDGSREVLPYLECTDGKKVYPHTDITRIYADMYGGVWIATQQEGVLYWHPDIIRIRTINSSTLSAGEMQDESVKCLAETPDGKVLVGTVCGLLLYDPATNGMTVPYPELKEELVIGLSVDRTGRIWAGTFYNGVYCIDGGVVRHFTYPEETSVDVSYQRSVPNRNCVRLVAEDPDGHFWISVYGGLGRFDPDTGEIRLLRESHPELARFMVIRDVAFLPDGTFLAVGDNGRFRYDPGADSVLPLDNGMSAITTNQVLADSKGTLWLAESGGLESLQSDDVPGMAADFGTVMGIAEDPYGGIWASSISDILRILPSRASARYGQQDGVDCGAFFQRSVLRHSDGHLYFGGSSGFCIIDPATMQVSDFGTRPYISAFEVAGKPLPAKSGASLKYNETEVSFAFTNLNYANPAHSEYLYRLDGFEKEWHPVTSAPLGQAHYTFLKPGKYTFLVRATNNGTDWSEPTALSFEVKPPFWRSRWAYLFYALLLLGALGGTVRYFRRLEKRRRREQTEKDRRAREEELNQMKFRFFTNVSHELRTPLSLIILPLESLMKEKSGTGEYARLETMHRNAKSLLDLVNHLLDFRRLEMGGEKVHPVKGDFSEFVETVLDPFRIAAQEKGVSLDYTDEADNPFIAFDGAMMRKVVNNLLSNALKFTPKGGAVHVRLYDRNQGELALSVADTGIGIPKEEQNDIFDRFYRSGNAVDATGSGIGLSLVKQYVEMHGGTVSVASEPGEGSTFVITLPAVREAASDEDMEAPPDMVREGRKHLLVVEDNADFRQYLQEELSGQYLVSVAVDGQDALERVGTERPDIVISDVMMPRLGGIELTRRLKEDIETSHIPVILLTARSSDEIRTEGYEYGADAYLTKPFRMEMLQARIRNLLEEREKRIRSFSGTAEVSPMHVTITTVDQKLMARITEKLEANLDNPEYSVEQMASDVGMHRMNLYRKIQSLYGMTPSEFIRTMRLKRAAQLLTDDPNLSVTEVADMVGFNTPKYFTKYFKELFGVLPSQYNRK